MSSQLCHVVFGCSLHVRHSSFHSTRRRPLLGNRLPTASPSCSQSALPLTHRRDQWGLQALVQSEEVLDALTLRREAWAAIETVDGAVQRVICFSEVRRHKAAAWGAGEAEPSAFSAKLAVEPVVEATFSRRLTVAADGTVLMWVDALAPQRVLTPSSVHAHGRQRNVGEPVEVREQSVAPCALRRHAMEQETQDRQHDEHPVGVD